MFTYDIDYALEPFIPTGSRALELMRFFGMTQQAVQRRVPRYTLSLTLSPGQICYITGPSGSGKSAVLNALYAQTPPTQRIRLDQIAAPDDRTTIDCFDGPLHRVLRDLGNAGLSDIPTLLLSPSALSDGQRWRYRLAAALQQDRAVVLVDEFCAALDALTALVVSCHLRRVADRTGRIFVLAGCRDDVAGELCPDVLVSLSCSGVQVHPRTQSCTLHHREVCDAARK